MIASPGGTEPLIVLSSHRAGSSAFMGLLADAGLHVGELLPPAPDNPRGFIENRHVVEINRRLLYDRDRDWTCPPPRLDHRTVDLPALERVGADLRGPGRPWGFKDPRTLFTAPAWGAALGPCRLVGVHRNTDDIARSLAARNELTFDQAKAIALAYAQRLAEVHRRLGFPIISFDGEREEFLARTELLATLAGLRWDPAAAEASYEPRLVHHRSAGDDLHPIDAYLAEASSKVVDELRSFTPATIVRVWDSVPSDLAASLPTNLGPRHAIRRSEMLRWAMLRLPEKSNIGVIESDERPVTLESSEITSISAEVLQVPDAGSVDDGTRWSHVVAPTLLDDVPPAGLGAVLDAVSRRLEHRAIVAVGGWVLDSADLPSAHEFPMSHARASRSQAPYLHHIDEINALLLSRGLHVSGVERTKGGRTHLYVTNDRGLQASKVTSAELRDQLDEAQATLRHLEDALAESRSGAKEALERLTESETEAAELRGELERAERAATSARKAYQALANRRAVKLALKSSRSIAPVMRAFRGLRGTDDLLRRTRAIGDRTSRPDRPRRSRQDLVAEIRSRAGTSAATGPAVSIVILTRDGFDHLARLLPALDRSTYRPFEVVVVDNGSTDDTPSLLQREWSFPIVPIRNDHNTSFSAGNNQGAARATGELLLFLNNDIEPIDDGWLGEMVAALITGEPAPAAVGALLVYPERGDPRTDLTVQHAGISLGYRDGALRAFNLTGDDPLDPGFAATTRVPAATAAALLLRRSDFEEVGGFDEAYVYGAEDVDLCLRLRARGDVVVAGRAAAFHHESATQSRDAGDIVRINRMGNWRRFAEVWTPTLSRSMRAAALRGAPWWTGRPAPKAVITLTQDDVTAGWGDYYTAHQLGDAFSSAGWEVVYAERYQDRWYELPGDADLVVSLLDSFDVRRAPSNATTIAWVRNWLDRWMDREWFEDFDLVVTSSHTAADIVAASTRFDPPVLPLAADHRLFRPGPPHPTFVADYAFTGNNWGVGRDIVPLLNIRAEERFLLFGKGWDQDPRVARYWRGHLPHHLLPELYRSVPIVLDDTAGPTLPHAFVNGRVFEALASGALVLSDNEAGSKELFDGDLPTYRDAADLRQLLDRFLGDPDGRRELAGRLREVVVERHTYDHRAREFVEVALAAIDKPLVAVKIGVPDEEQARSWGDYHFATALVRTLSKEGFRARVDLLPQWDDPALQDADVVIHLRGLTTYAPKPAQVNVMWVISHPDEVTPEECDKYDLVLVASQSFAEELDAQTKTRVVFLPQATDARRFGGAQPDPDLGTDLLFVGNSRNQHRPAVQWSIEAGLQPTIYGQDWDGLVEDRFVRDVYFPNEDLGRLYASSKIVLNDHWPDMRDRGFVSNRILDALASGALVLSDRVAGLESLLGDAVPTYGSPAELAELVRRFSSDPELRATTVEKGRGLVLSEHTFDVRARQLRELLGPLLAGRPRDLDGNIFDNVAGVADRPVADTSVPRDAASS